MSIYHDKRNALRSNNGLKDSTAGYLVTVQNSVRVYVFQSETNVDNIETNKLVPIDDRNPD